MGEDFQQYGMWDLFIKDDGGVDFVLDGGYVGFEFWDYVV